MSYIKTGRLLLAFVTLIHFQTFAQSGADAKKQAEQERVKSLINSKKFKFHALSATSQKGRTVQLNTEYYLKLNNDSLDVDLPYYGRSFTTDYPPTDLSVHFTSSQFTYAADSTKKGGWQITIKPKNENKASKIFMSVSSNGYCSMQITSNSRQPISYYGTIQEY